MAKAVLDTNVLIGILLGSHNCLSVREAFLDGLFDIVISPEIAAELVTTCRKPKLSKLIHLQDMKETIDLLKTDAEWVDPRIKINASRDPKDNIILECAVAGKADYIVSGDQDLLVLKSFRKIPIVTPRQFLAGLRRF
jgi:uncharacterized protein